jgi:primosomal protein N' (replication factor Y)
MYAKVIVDVPARETNRPFDYAIPPELAPWVRVGCRVKVGFGPRTLQGFVVGLAAECGTDPAKVKPILEVLDVVPPLTEELVELARWMSRRYVCHELAALQAMIPSALKARYVKRLRAADAVDEAALAPEERELLAGLRRAAPWTFEELLRRYPGQGAVLRSLLNKGALAEVHEVRDRIAVKKVLTVAPAVSPEALRAAAESCPPRASRQREVLLYFAASPEPVRQSALAQQLGISLGTIKAMAEKGWLRVFEEEVYRDPYAEREFTRTAPLALTPEQSAVLEAIVRAVDAREARTFLLHGVTGSGKTEVYLQAIRHCLEKGREAIVLVPEISLTPQMVERFKGRFGDEVAVMHSRLSHGERYDEWRKVVERRVRVVIGARSAVFAPFRNIGLIIIDEEHESSYKQEESPKYHAKDVAVERAARHGAVVVLGSATPSLESYQETRERAITLLTMQKRVEGRPLPPVAIVDMREELRRGNRSMFSGALHAAILDRLSRQEQIVLLLNRRGHSTFVMCRACGYTAGCPHCDISLTYHRSSRTMRCHYCGYAAPELTVCPDCGSEYIRYFGTGTQKVEEELGKTFPGIRVIRMDVDTTAEKDAHEKLLARFRRKQADVLLGTQMVAKGLDFPDVTLVGVIAADTVLRLPDFRAAERTFQLLTQVAGRAGRHRLPGEVIVQTYHPDHYSVVLAGKHDYRGFAEQELAARLARGYPPFRRLILITFQHEQVPVLMRVSEQFVRDLHAALARIGGSAAEQAPFEVLGPIASPIPRINDRYRFQCVVKYAKDLNATAAVRETVQRYEEAIRQLKLQISVDVNPQVLL